jgi:MYXO-CTERM domain-containing protein
LNETGLTPGSGPDGSSNGTVDLADHTFWRSKFGNNAGSGSAASAPEPATGALLLLALFSLRFTRRHR